MIDRVERNPPSRSRYALQIGDVCYTTGTYKHVVDAYDAIMAFREAVLDHGSDVPVVVQLLM